ncbi:MAG: type toxin-antitoxin system HicB family antitoxin [Devosia sp.]|nr:type toxin-antitoxin system HicB family antitoxin [Devosia sp.]
MHQSYLARFQEDGEGFVVTFPDFPEANTAGENLDEAVANAIDALEVTVLTYTKDMRTLPEPRKRPDAGGSYRWVSIGAATAAKVAFIEAFRASGTTRTALAGKLGKAETEVRRMLDPYHATKLPALEAGLRAMGKQFVISVADIAA